MRITGVGQALLAVLLVGLGVLGLVKGELTPVWAPIPKWAPREVLGYACSILSLVGCAGLLWRRTSSIVAGVLLAWLLVWWMVFRLPPIVHAPTVQDPWSGAGETAVVIAAVWILFATRAGESGPLSFAAGNRGLTIARAIYGLALIPFGAAHFYYFKETAGLVPAWLPAHAVWAAFTGAAYVAAGVAIITGVAARLAAVLSTVQMGAFAVLVWFPIIAAGATGAFVWSETIVSVALTFGGWVVADSYRGQPWLRRPRA